jgi:hypothetical protein
VSPFDGCWDRIDRARVHSDAFASEFVTFAKSGAYEISTRCDDAGFGEIRIRRVKEPPPILSIHLGEMLYNLRAALDGCIYQTAILDSGQDPPPDDGQLEFPICRTPENFANSQRKIAPLSDKHRRWIEDVQPYTTRTGGALKPKPDPRDSLAMLNHLARIDRHRYLHVVGTAVTEAAPHIIRERVDPNVSVRFIEQTQVGFVEDEFVVARFQIVGGEPGMEYLANPALTIEPEIHEARSLANRHPYSVRTQYMIAHVAGIVDAFGREFGYFVGRPPVPRVKVDPI